MLYYDRIDVSQGIDVNKTNASKDYYVCHDLLMMSVNLGDINIINMKALIITVLLVKKKKIRL